jgi:hypothetical protein
MPPISILKYVIGTDRVENTAPTVRPLFLADSLPSDGSGIVVFTVVA